MASQNWYSPVNGNGSMVTNGQIVPTPMASAFFPNLASAPFYQGNGQPPPTVPLSYMNAGSGGNQLSSVAAANPFSFTMSPLLMAVIALVVGMLGLRYIHWR